MTSVPAEASTRARRRVASRAALHWSQARLQALFCTLAASSVLLGGGQLSRAEDPYATALDKRFSSGTSPAETPNPNEAALEEGVKKQAQEMAQRPEPPAPPDPEGFEHFFLWGFGIAGALLVSLTAMIALRRWNSWLDAQAAKRELAFADDPLMVEFLRALHEDLKSGPLAARPVEAPVEPSAAGTTTDSKSVLAAERQSASPLTKSLALLRTEFQKLSRAPDDAQRLSILRGLLEHVEVVKQSCELPELRSAKLLASGLHGLLKQLSLKAPNITPSALRTAAAAMDLLEILCTRGSRPDLATTPPVRLLAVDDDPISLRAVLLALKKAFNDSDVASDGQSALALAVKQPYDVAFLDIEMPGMDGFELCSKLHETVDNRATPVVFVTSHSDFDSRAKSALVGAHDLIGKPFLAFEIAVKALTLVLRARQEREAKGAPSEKQTAGPVTATYAGPLNRGANPAAVSSPSSRAVAA